MPNLVKLYTPHGAMYIDTDQLSRGRKLLTIYTSHGNRLKDVGATQEIRENASYGVNHENLYATQELADAASDAVWRELYGEKALTTKQLRETEHLLPA